MDSLPDEILINILKYLTAYDLLQFCEVFRNLDYFLKEKNLIGCANWSRKYEMHKIDLCNVISSRMCPVYITVLKINCIYWIPVQDLRRLLQKLENLEELYAVDTKLGCNWKDQKEYLKLRKLSISVEDFEFDYETVVSSKNLKLLKALYIKIVHKKNMRQALLNLDLFLVSIVQLEELWVQDDYESPYRLNYERLLLSLKNLTKLVVHSIHSKNICPIYDFEFSGLFKTFECRRHTTVWEAIFERITKNNVKQISIFEPKCTDFEKAWDALLNVYHNLPCGPKESRLIHLQKEINSIQLEELNFSDPTTCIEKYVNAKLDILKSKNCENLKKLKFRSCLLQDFQGSKKQGLDISLAKKPRIGIKVEIGNHPFKLIPSNLQDLVELEIDACQKCIGSSVVSAYSLIEEFPKLQRLTLEILYLIDGSFLNNLFIKCPQLESLSLTIMGPNEKFMNNLCQSLEFATSLRDFRLDCCCLNIEKILNSLSGIPSKKVSRIFLKCDKICCSSNRDPIIIYSTFLKQNLQLVFFFMIISELTEKQKCNIQKTLNLCKEKNPAKIFRVDKDMKSCLPTILLPAAHHDIINNFTRVAMINFDEF